MNEEVNKTIEENKNLDQVDKENVSESVLDNQENKENVSPLSETENVFTIEDFNKIETTNGTLQLNKELFMELKTTNLYLNLILIAIVLCFLYLVISKALKKLFYVNIY